MRITTRLRQTDATLIVNRQDTCPAAEGAEISSAKDNGTKKVPTWIELCRANEILRKASVYFAQAAFDRRPKT